MRAALSILLVLAPGAALADPVFLDRSGTLPVEHVYGGGWEHFVGGGVAVFDCNDDGLPEFLAAGGANPARLFVNTTAGPGAPLAFALGDFPEILETTGAYPLDIDGDGILDLVVLRVGGNLLLRGTGACRFEPANDRWGFDGGDKWSTAFSATWEGDGLPTLAVGNYVDRTNPQGPFEACDTNTLYRPDGDRYGPPITLSPGYCALSILFSDWSRSGHADLRLSNDRHYYVRNGHEQMLRMSDLKFLGEEDGWKPISIWGMGIASEDITGDGRPDLMLTSMGDQLVQLSTPDGWEPAPFSIGAYAQRPWFGDDGRPSTGWHAQFGDVDNDGRADLFIAKGNVDQMQTNAIEDPNNLLMQQADGTFVEKADVAGVASLARSRGAALADLNADGRLDLIVVNRRAPLELYENATEGTGHWLAVDLLQPGGNVRAVGAWIEVRDGTGRLQTREVTVGGGHAGGQALAQHFGVGAADSAEVRVTWPDGRQSAWTPVGIDRVTTLRCGDGGVAVPVSG